MAAKQADRLSRFGDDTEGFLLFYELEPLEDEEEVAARLRLLRREGLLEVPVETKT